MENKKKIVVLTGAGVSAESGIKTFRDSGGTWEQYKLEDVATPQGWFLDPKKVLEFYDKRREDCVKAKPNQAHFNLKKLEEKYDVWIISQNIDDLHEKAGSTNVIHLHGEIMKARSVNDDSNEKLYDVGPEGIQVGQLCPAGYQLRPHVVWFGEMVPNLAKAQKIVSEADICVVIGTSFTVYPAASLFTHSNSTVPVYIIDPKKATINDYENRIIFIEKKAVAGTKQLLKILMK